MIIYLWCLQRGDKKTQPHLPVWELFVHSADVGGAFGLCCCWWDCVTSSCFKGKSTVWFCCELPLFPQWEAFFFTALRWKLPSAHCGLNAALGGRTSVWIWPSCSLLRLDQNCFTLLQMEQQNKEMMDFFPSLGGFFARLQTRIPVRKRREREFSVVWNLPHSGCSPSARGRVWICAASPALLLQDEPRYICGCQSRVSCQFKGGRRQQWRLTVFNANSVIYFHSVVASAGWSVCWVCVLDRSGGRIHRCTSMVAIKIKHISVLISLANFYYYDLYGCIVRLSVCLCASLLFL